MTQETTVEQKKAKLSLGKGKKATSKEKVRAKAPKAKETTKEKKGKSKEKATEQVFQPRKRKDDAYYKGKYPHYVPGSLGYDELAKKAICKAKCVDTGKVFECYTSDLFQSKRCPEALAEYRKAKRSGKPVKEAKPAKKTTKKRGRKASK